MIGHRARMPHCISIMTRVSMDCLFYCSYNRTTVNKYRRTPDTRSDHIPISESLRDGEVDIVLLVHTHVTVAHDVEGVGIFARLGWGIESEGGASRFGESHSSERQKFTCGCIAQNQPPTFVFLLREEWCIHSTVWELQQPLSIYHYY